MIAPRGGGTCYHVCYDQAQLVNAQPSDDPTLLRQTPSRELGCALVGCAAWVFGGQGGR